MREILFRGKCIDNGEWVEGFYSRCLQKGENNKPCECHVILEVSDFDGKLYTLFSYFDIDPATVGQYTGLTDKNGKKIWEGDICTIPGSKKQGLPGVIRYWMPEAQFVLSRSSYNDINLDNSEQWLEIIGNAADNPELLQN